MTQLSVYASESTQFCEKCCWETHHHLSCQKRPPVALVVANRTWPPKIMTKSSSKASENPSKWRGWNNNSRWVKRRNERKGKTFQSATNQWKLLRITVNSKAYFPRWARLCWWSPFYFKVQVRKIMLHHFIRLRQIWNHLRSNHESICEGLMCWQNVKLELQGFCVLFWWVRQCFWNFLYCQKLSL